nr:MAG TPA: hypothetical protein [Caudoviricetes sp.]
MIACLGISGSSLGKSQPLGQNLKFQKTDRPCLAWNHVYTK